MNASEPPDQEIPKKPNPEAIAISGSEKTGSFPKPREGRPQHGRGKYGRKMTAAARERVIGALLVGASIGEAAEVVPCSRQAITDERKRNAAFSKRVEEARGIADAIVEHNLFALSTRHPVAAIFWLINRKPEEWKDRKEVRQIHEIVTYEASIGDDGTITRETKTGGESVH